MNKLDRCYLESLSEVLKGNLGEALDLRNEADALASDGFSFSESYENKYPFIEEAVNTLLGSYDFTRCVRADGSAYGTRGKCKKGKESAAVVREGTGARGSREAAEQARSRGERGGDILRARAVGRKEALAQSRKAGGEKQSDNNAVTRAYKAELLKLQREGSLKGKSSEEIDKSLKDAYLRAKKNPFALVSRKGTEAGAVDRRVAGKGASVKERKEATREKRLTSNATWRLMRQVLDTPEVKSLFSSLEKKGDVEGARALYTRIEAEAMKKANAGEGRLAKSDSRTPASAGKARASEKARKSPGTPAKEPARRWVNNREFAQAGVMHPDMASEMKVGMSTDFYDKKTGDKMSGKVMSNNGKFISIKADKDGREAAGAVQRFKIAREAGSPELQ